MLKIIKKSFANLKKYDITIVGGGLVGLSLANKLSKHTYFSKKKILLIEKNNIFNNDYTKYSPRTYSINNLSLKFLGLENKSKKRTELCNKVEGIQIWSNDSSEYLKFENANKEENNFGTILNHNFIAGELTSNLKEKDNIDFIFDSTIKSLKNKKNKGVNFKIKNKKGEEEEIDTNLMISAEGGNSFLVNESKLYYKGFSHNQKGLVTKLKVDKNFNYSFQKFINKEVIGILPLKDNFCSIVWSVNNDYFDYISNLNEENFLEELNSKISSVSGNEQNDGFLEPPRFLEMIDRPLGFPLFTKYLEKFYSDNIVFIGDSAHSIHPMLGQGLNLGFYDAEIFCKLFFEHVESGRSSRSPDFFENYDFKAKLKTQTFQNFVEFLKFSYSFDNIILKKSRDTVIHILNSNSFLKNMISKVAN